MNSDHVLHPACWSETDLLAQCKWTFSRASGPGGQNRNKVETSAHIEHVPSGISAHASERRSQNENRKVALQRLRCKLAIQLRIQATPEDLDLSVWKTYCRDGRINVSETNDEWPNVLALVMESLDGNQWDVTAVADLLGTSTSQLVKLLKKESGALAMLNVQRASRSLRPLT
jgi:hypothetical protein